MTIMSVSQNIADIRAKIAKTCAAYGRDPAGVNLVAVSKMQPLERITAALDAGQRLFGENRVQEAKARWSDLRDNYPDLKLHLIGPLQTNKVKDAVKLFDCIETVDRVELVDALVKVLGREDSLSPALSQRER